MAAEGTGLLIPGVGGAANNLHRQSMRTVLPHTLEGFRNFHLGDTIVVCGCGKSLTEFADLSDT